MQAWESGVGGGGRALAEAEWRAPSESRGGVFGRDIGPATPWGGGEEGSPRHLRVGKP
jgi:hypothetical protein